MDYTERMTLRLTADQMQFLTDIGTLLGISPSEYIRMVIQMGMSQQGNQVKEMIEKAEHEKGEVGSSNENDKTNSNNIV